MIELNNMRKNDWQYTIIHSKTSDFKTGEKVFLKSSPEMALTVSGVREDYVLTTYCEGIYKANFYPQTILQYRYASLLTYKDKINICIN